MNATPFTIERTYDVSVAEVWSAITNPTKMKEWYFDIPAFKAVVGSEFEFSGGTPEKQYRHLCKVTEVVLQKKLAYTWKYDGYPGESVVTFELFEEGDQTRLRLTHTGLETFAQDDPNMRKESFAAGWTMIIGKNLLEYLNRK